jgi:hypothetical protein
MLRNLELYYFFFGKSVNYDDPKILLLQVLLPVLWKKTLFFLEQTSGKHLGLRLDLNTGKLVFAVGPVGVGRSRGGAAEGSGGGVWTNEQSAPPM